MPDIRTIKDLGNLVRGRRIELALTQAELARRARLSRKWVYEFEAGKPGAELGAVMAVLEALDLRLIAAATVREDDPNPHDLDRILADYQTS